MQISISILVANATSGISYVKRLVKNFKARVLSYPNSIFEAEPCLVATLTELNNIELLRQSSLVITPNAYNEGVLYDVIPNTPLGDMDVVRATTATRVNSAGLIEVVPRNLLTYSQDFSNAAWVKSNSPTMTYNSAIAPNGTLTASGLKSNDATNYKSINQTISSISPNSTFTYSIYVKKETSETFFGGLSLYFSGATPKVFFGIVNAVNGTVTLASSSITPTIQVIDFGTYWRIIATATDTGSNTSVLAEYYATFSQNGTSLSTGIGSVRTIWGAQLVEGSTATEYFPTTTRLNIPRIDYTNGSCPSLLVEPQRTNLLTYSEQFDNAAWTKNNLNVTANATIAPNGTMTAEKIVGTAINATHIALQQVPFSVNTVATCTIYAKAAELNFLYVGGLGRSPSANEGYVFFNLSNGTVGANDAGYTGSISNVGNGWYRLTVNAPSMPTSTLREFRIGVTNTNGMQSYLGDGTSGVFVWGAQLEAGAYPTSYIPTVASSVTRNADVISKTGISSLIDSQQGVLFADLQFFTEIGNIRSIHISNGSNNNRIGFFGHPSVANRITFAISSGGVITDINFNGVTLTNRNKVLIRYSGTTFTGFINGVKSTNQTFTPFAANFLNRIGLDYGEDILRYEGRINSIQLYKTALTDAECIALTTI